MILKTVCTKAREQSSQIQISSQNSLATSQQPPPAKRQALAPSPTPQLAYSQPQQTAAQPRPFMTPSYSRPAAGAAPRPATHNLAQVSMLPATTGQRLAPSVSASAVKTTAIPQQQTRPAASQALPLGSNGV